MLIQDKIVRMQAPVLRVRRVIGYLSSRIGRASVRMSTLIVGDGSLDQARASFLSSRLAATRGVVDRAIERGELPAAPGLMAARSTPEFSRQVFLRME